MRIQLDEENGANLGILSLLFKKIPSITNTQTTCHLENETVTSPDNSNVNNYLGKHSQFGAKISCFRRFRHVLFLKK